jgi:MoxR-like ATPase
MNESEVGKREKLLFNLDTHYRTYTCTCALHRELRRSYPYMDTNVVFAALTADQQEELDKMIKEATDVLTRGGVTFDATKVREMMTKRLAEAKGWEVEEPAKATAKKKATPAEPTAPVVKPVTVNDGEKVLTTEAVEKALEEGHEAYFYEAEDDIKFLDHFIDLKRKARIVGNLLLTGPSGSGKTEGLKRLAARKGMPFYKMDCGTITTEEKWVGRREIDSEGTKFKMSEHLKWLEGIEYEPGLVCYDEINRVHPSKHNILLPILDGSQSLFVPDMDRYVIVHPDNIVVATANQGSAFGGIFQMDRAFRERFNFTMERNFPPVTEEIKVLVSRTNCDAAKAKLMVDIADQTRRKWKTGDLESPVSTRTLIAASYLVASGMSVVGAFGYTVLPLYKDDGGAQSERAMVRLIVAGKSS